MFPIVVNDGQTPFPKDDIFYIICKEGVYLKKKLGVMDSIAPVKNISILESVQTSATMHVRKIPAINVQQIINFFKAVYKEHYAEAIVLLFYNIEKKHYKIFCPHQEVNSGAAEYNKGITIEGYDMIGTIHSHASMSAFHSSIDDDDEKSFDGLHITFGNMRDDDISISASIVANGHRVIVNPSDYINNLVKTVDVDEEVKVPYSKTWKWDKDEKKMVEIQTSGRYYTRKEFDQRFQVQLSRDPKFPVAWMKRVEKKAYTTYKRGNYGHWAEGWYGYGARFDGEESYWKNWQGHNKQGNKNLPALVNQPASTTIGAKTEERKDTTPCDDCTFKNHKIGIALDQLDEVVKRQVIEWALDEVDQDANFTISESLGEDGDDLSHYECVSCGSRFSIDESNGNAACPLCKTDDYLSEISASEVLMGDDDELVVSDEEIDDSYLSMHKCDICGSTFTKDFAADGHCPTCGVVLDVHTRNRTIQSEDDYIHCPDCSRSFEKVRLESDASCPFCFRDFDMSEITDNGASTEETNIETAHQDSGDYLNPDTEAIQAAIEADQDAERIPIPGQDSIPINKQRKKSGIFANIFKGRKKK